VLPSLVLHEMVFLLGREVAISDVAEAPNNTNVVRARFVLYQVAVLLRLVVARRSVAVPPVHCNAMRVQLVLGREIQSVSKGGARSKKTVQYASGVFCSASRASLPA